MAGRPRAFDEREVLSRAVELFWQNGFRGTTTRDLEQNLGLSQSSIYNAFGSKAELLHAALDHYEASVESELLTLLDQEDGARALSSFFEELARWVGHPKHRGALLENLLVEDGGRDAELVKRARVSRNRLRKCLSSALQRLPGSPSREVAEERAELLLGLAMGIVVTGRAGASRAELKKLVSAAMVAAQCPS